MDTMINESAASGSTEKGLIILLLFFVVVLLVCFFRERVFLCSSGGPATHFVDHTVLKITETLLPLPLKC